MAHGQQFPEGLELDGDGGHDKSTQDFDRLRGGGRSNLEGEMALLTPALQNLALEIFRLVKDVGMNKFERRDLRKWITREHKSPPVCLKEETATIVFPDGEKLLRHVANVVSAKLSLVVDQRKRAALPVEEKDQRRNLLVTQRRQKRQRTAAADDSDGSQQARKNHNAWKERMRRQGVAYTGGYDAAGLPHGNGKLVYGPRGLEGRKAYYHTWGLADYEGNFKNGKHDGKGTLRWKTGDTYIGLFKDGKFDGQGVMTWASGASYDGEWENDKKHGQGTEMIGDQGVHPIVSTVYVGTFHHNQRHGLGKMTYNIVFSDSDSDCDDYSDDVGEWKNDLFLGNNNNQQ